MGLFGIITGTATTFIGIIKDDEELIKKGAKRTAYGMATTLIGDYTGISDIAGCTYEAMTDNEL